MKPPTIIWVAVYLIASISCVDKHAEDRFVVVEKYNEKYIEDSINNIPYDYYVGDNVILPENSDYSYYHDTKRICGTGWKVSTKPISLDFETKPLFKFKSTG